MANKLSPRIWASIIFPLILAILVSWIQSAQLINGLVALSDKSNTAHTEKLVRSAFAAYKTRISAYAYDNAFWDDAARHVYLERNYNWFSATFPTSTSDEDPMFNTVAVVNGNNNQVEFFHSGYAGQTGAIADLFGNDWKKLKSALDQKEEGSGAISTFVNTPKGEAIVAAAAIYSSNPELAKKENQPHYMVFLRYIDQSFLSRLSQQYAIEGLTLSSPDVGGRKGLMLIDEISLHALPIMWNSSQKDFASNWELWRHALTSLAVTLTVLIGMAVANFRSLLNIERSEKKAIYDSAHDSLTGLGNRAAFNQEIDNFKNGAVLFADLDRFKAVNDQYGHKVGDLLLKKIAQIMSQNTHGSGKCYRLGGDEFVVLFHGKEQKQNAVRFASRMIELVKTPFDLGEMKVAAGISIGIALAGENEVSGQSLVHLADEAMYCAKNAGRNQYFVFDSTDVPVKKLKHLSKVMKKEAEPKNSLALRSSAA